MNHPAVAAGSTIIHKGTGPTNIAGTHSLSIPGCVYPSAMSQADRHLVANGEPARVKDTVEGFGETYLTLEHRETGEELGTVAESDITQS